MECAFVLVSKQTIVQVAENISKILYDSDFLESLLEYNAKGN